MNKAIFQNFDETVYPSQSTRVSRSLAEPGTRGSSEKEANLVGLARAGQGGGSSWGFGSCATASGGVLEPRMEASRKCLCHISTIHPHC